MRSISTALLGAALVASSTTASAATAYNSTNPALVIYTYPSLLGATNAVGDTYDFVAAYANYSGLSYDSIVVLRMESADLASNAANWTGAGLPFAPDVVIGMDQTTAATEASTGLFYSYNLTSSQNRVSYLANLEAINYAKPFDYGYTAVIYDPVKLPAAQKAFNNQSNFSLQRLIDTGLIANLTVNDPTTDTSGIDFMMWTIAELGDGKNITGIYGSNGTTWQQWWKTAFQSGLQVIRSWDNSFSQFSDPTVPNVGMISSYGFDSAYDVCQNYSDSLIPVISTVNGTQAGWLTVEVYSIVANSSHLAQARNFSNWFFDDANSAQIPTSQWSAAANADVPLPACYYESDSIIPSNTTTNLNTRLSKQASTAQNFDTWLAQWVQLYNTYSNQANSSKISL